MRNHDRYSLFLANSNAHLHICNVPVHTGPVPGGKAKSKIAKLFHGRNQRPPFISQDGTGMGSCERGPL